MSSKHPVESEASVAADTSKLVTSAAHVERERSHFRALLLSNPNYFGTLKKSALASVVQIANKQRYESIGCVGFQPQQNTLEAVINIRQSFGYGGGVCSSGSLEYVRFYVSYDGGATWDDQGLRSFRVHDAPSSVRGTAPLEFAVTRPFTPRRNYCFQNNTLRVRAILSWGVAPLANDPDYIPVWGSVAEANVQADPRRRFIITDLPIFSKLPVQFAKLLQNAAPIDLAVPQPLGAAELSVLYKDQKVEPHRLAFNEIQQALSSSGLAPSFASPGPASTAQGAVAASSLGNLLDFDPLAKLGIDFAKLGDLLIQQVGNTRYEQLDCVGLDEATSSLVGVLRLKLPNGYSGGPCSAGSREYVAFWADTNNNGTFETYLGTTSVNVHDISPLPAGGLEYAVRLPIDVAKYRRPCSEGPRIFKVRAVLSWQAAPPAWNPNFVPTWGNRAEALVLIASGPVVQPGVTIPFLSAVGDIPSTDVNASGKASGTAIHTGFVASDSPFGGRITVAGHIANATSGLRYRVVKKPHGAADSDYVPLTNGFAQIVNTWDSTNGWVQHHVNAAPLSPAADGYFSFEDYSSNHTVEGNLMGVFSTGLEEDGKAYDLRIEVKVDSNPANNLVSNVVTVLVDNTPPVAELSLDLAPGTQCGHFQPGEIVHGSFRATDTHFGSYSFEIVPSGPPNNPTHGALPTPSSGSHAFIPDPGVPAGTYSLDTTPMDPCGYAVILHVWDRTNVNSGGGSNYSKASVGFCLEGEGE